MYKLNEEKVGRQSERLVEDRSADDRDRRGWVKTADHGRWDSWLYTQEITYTRDIGTGWTETFGTWRAIIMLRLSLIIGGKWTLLFIFNLRWQFVCATVLLAAVLIRLVKSVFDWLQIDW